MKLHTQALDFLVEEKGFTREPYKRVARKIAARDDVLLDESVDVSDKHAARALGVGFAINNGRYPWRGK